MQTRRWWTQVGRATADMTDVPDLSAARTTRRRRIVVSAGSLDVTLRRLQTYGIILVWLALFVAIGIKEPTFVHKDSLLNLLQQWAPVGIMALAGTFVIIAGGFDFSVGGVFAFAATLSAGLTQHHGLPLGYLLTLLMGIGIGITNGLIITRLHVNPFIATIGSGTIFRGIALIYSGGAPIIVTVGGFTTIGAGHIGSFPISGVFLIGLFVIGGFVLARSVYGRWVYMIGGNAEASRLTGLRVNRILVATYALSGLSAALAGILFSSRLGLGQADFASGTEIDVVIAIVIGGTAIGGGTGAVWRTAVGLAILATMQNGFDALNVGANTQVVIKGAILIAAVAWDEFVKRRRARAAVVSGTTRFGPRQEPEKAEVGAPAETS